jgi:UDP-N-acetylglucosamine--N-acetylmuramyl-(pentapeptide) pyrophosphoryl-undecaprenol N-acetylglucosamine transferase
MLSRCLRSAVTLRVLISGGGTGGHIYPCLSVARSLAGARSRSGAQDDNASDVQFLYIGGPRPIDRRLVEEAGLPFEAVDVGGLRGMGLEALANAAKLPAGLARTVRLVRRFDPHVALVSGGYVSAPVVAATALLRVPLVVLTVEIEQGWVNMTAARLAQAVTASFPPALAHLPPERTVLTGYPVREQFLHLDRDRARAGLELDPGLPVLAVFGGSLGSHRINEALAGTLPDMLLAAQVLHVCGQADLARLQERQTALPATLRTRYRLFDYLPAKGMADLLAAADLAVCRAGAAPLAELPLAGTPAIMVPGQFSSQSVNAAYMREQGAAVLIADKDLTADALHQQALALLRDEARLAEMAEKMRALARPDAAIAIASLVRRIAGVGRL